MYTSADYFTDDVQFGYGASQFRIESVNLKIIYERKWYSANESFEELSEKIKEVYDKLDENVNNQICKRNAFF